MMPACGSANIPDCLFSALRYALARLSHRCSSAGYDEPAILSYAISSFCPTSADGLHSRLIASPPPRCLRIASNPGGDRRRWFGLRKYEWLVLSDPNLRIGDANRDFGGRITPQERNPPGGKENARADGHGGKTLRRQPARMAQRTDTWHPIAVPCQFTFFLSCITFDVLSTGSSTCESPPGLRLAARISEFVLVGFHIPLP